MAGFLSEGLAYDVTGAEAGATARGTAIGAQRIGPCGLSRRHSVTVGVSTTSLRHGGVGLDGLHGGAQETAGHPEHAAVLDEVADDAGWTAGGRVHALETVLAGAEIQELLWRLRACPQRGADLRSSHRQVHV
jgi:hypothetical protein